MKIKSVLSFSTAALALVLVLPAQAQNMQDASQDSGALRGSNEAMRMVPARTVLVKSLDADKVSDGFQFRATLARSVQLTNGPKLPAGTVLLGVVAHDDMNEEGTSKLALRFTQAVLKHGQMVPIKATIVGVYPGEDINSSGNPVTPGDAVPNSWNDGTLAVDQIGVMSDIDLHSKIASSNSGVFVSSKKDIKLAQGSEIAIAIAAQTPRQEAMNNTSDSH